MSILPLNQHICQKSFDHTTKTMAKTMMFVYVRCRVAVARAKDKELTLQTFKMHSSLSRYFSILYPLFSNPIFLILIAGNKKKKVNRIS